MNHAHFNPERRAIPLAAWPTADRQAWELAIRPVDLFDDGGAASQWRAPTKRLVAANYGHWLQFLAGRRLLDNDVSSADRVKPEIVLAYIKHEQVSCLDTTVHLRVLSLIEAVRCMFPDRDWSWLRRIAGRLNARIQTRREKEHRIRPAKDLYGLGIELMNEAAEGTKVPRRWIPVRYRDGLMIALLAARPIRFKNFISIQIGKQLTETSESYWFHFQPEETKTGQPIDVPIPADLRPWIEYYLDHYRPLLLGDTRSNYFWISTAGNPLSGMAAYNQITLRTKRAFGTAINPHLFRDCAATSIAIDDPGHVRIAAQILGHSTLETTTRYYNQANMLSAVRNHGAVLRRLRHKSRSAK